MFSSLMPSTPTSRSSEPSGVWQGLAARLTAESSTTVPTAGSAQLWCGLTQRADPANYRPQRIDNVATETTSEDAQTYTVLRSPNGDYLRLTGPQCELWQVMDGTHTIAELALLGFHRFGQLLPVAELVESLKQHGFLHDSSMQVYRQLAVRLEAQSIQGWGRRVLAVFQSQTWASQRVDAPLTTLYQRVGWVVFTRLFLVVAALTSIVGLGAFLVAISNPDRYATTIVLDPDQVVLSALGLWAALLVSFVLHESAHALAVKHFGRRVPRAGIMLYYGMPAAFVDTSDMWLARRPARIAVSLAGPFADLLVGGVASLVAIALAETLVGAGAFKLAFACYVATLFNLNPLLELDGYFVLVDWLDLPDLRRRAFVFVGGPFWAKLRSGLPFDQKERVLGLYGVLTAGYTLLAIVLAVVFWQAQFLAILAGLWQRGLGGQLFAALIAVAVIMPVALGLFSLVERAITAAARWLEQHDYASNPLVIASVAAVCTLLLATLPLRGYPTGWLVPLLWSGALLVQLVLRSDYRGAAITQAFRCFAVATTLTLIASSERLFALDLLAWSLLEVLGLVLVMIGGFIALFDVDAHYTSARELGLSAVLFLVAFGIGGATVAHLQTASLDQPLMFTLMQAAPPYLGVLALALLLPKLFGIADSRLFWFWLVLWFGIATQVVAYLAALLTPWRDTVALAVATLAAGLWLTAWLVHYVVLRGTLQPASGTTQMLATNTTERLQQAFAHCYAGCYQLLHTNYGARRARAFDDKLDVLAATANWDVTLDGDTVRIGAHIVAQPLDVQGARYAEVLRYTVATVEEVSGARFALHAIQSAYDSLPWPEREVADQHCFPNTPWAQVLSRSFADQRTTRLRLLRSIEHFALCSDDELVALVATLQTVTIRAGSEIAASGVQAVDLWIVEAGEVVTVQDRQVSAELHRGDCFGSVEDTANNASTRYRASVDSALLVMPHAAFQQVVRSPQHTAHNQELAQTLRLFERVPLLRELPRRTLHTLAAAAEQCQFAERSIVVRQGQRSHTLYVVAQGTAVVVQRDAQNAAHVVAQLGTAEFFGEIELLYDAPPIASVVARTSLHLIAIPHTALATLLTGSNTLTRV